MGRFDRILINRVLVCAVGYGTDPDADDNPAASSGTAYNASVQMASASQLAIQDRQGADAVFVVYFATEPVDTSAGADHQRLRVRDRILWQVDGVNGSVRTLVVSGPPRAEGGFGAAWSVDCEEIT